MSNASHNSQFVDNLSGSFFKWISTEILPYALGSALALCVFVGIILNIILLVVYKKRRLHTDPTNHYIPQIAIVDLLASFFVIVPSSVAGFLHKWPLPESVCTLHGVLVTWFHLLSFALVMVIFIERVFKSWNPGLHETTFNTHLFVVVIRVVVWAVDLLVALLPILGVGTLKFNSYQSQCSLVNKDHEIQTHVLFSLGIYSSLLLCIITFALLIEKRRRSVMHERKDEKNKLIDLNDSKETGQTGEGNVPGEKSGKTSPAPAEVVKNGPSKAWGDKGRKGGEDAGRTPLFKNGPNSPGSATDKKNEAKGKEPNAKDKKTKRELFLEKYNQRMSRPESKGLMKKIFRDKEDQKDHHQAMTALITWCVIEVCWIWYLVAAMMEIYSETEVWGGWHTLAVVLGDATYCIKPIVYLAHNRHYRNASKETLPETVKEKAAAISRKVSEATAKVDNMLFKSPGATKANKFRAALAALAAKRAIMRWKSKVAAKGGFAWGKKKPGVATIAEGNESADGGAVEKPTGPADTTKPNLTGASIAAAALAQAAAKKTDTGVAGEPAKPQLLQTTAPGTGTPEGERPVTKSSVVLSMMNRNSGGTKAALSPSPPPAVAENDLAQTLNPFSPQV